MSKIQIVVGSLIVSMFAALAFNLSRSNAGNSSTTKHLENELPTITTIGALGRIEPKSRVITLSHNEGPDGARIEKLKVAEGQFVNVGDEIAIFSDYEQKRIKLEVAKMEVLVAQAALEAELANQKYYQKDLERSAKLAKSNTVSIQSQDEIRKNYNQSLANFSSLEAQLNLAKINVDLSTEILKQSILKAPINGTIIKIHAWEGERIDDSGAVEIADLSQLDAVAEVYERDMPSVKVGQKAEIFVPGFKEPFYGEVRELGFKVLKNDLDGVNPLTTIDNRIIEVRITLDSKAVEKLKHLIYMEVDVRLL